MQKYVGGLGERYYHGGELHQAYAPHGTAAEIRVHSPDLRWLEGFARFSETEGRGGNADTRTHGFGLAFQPHFGGLSGWRTNAELAGDDLNVVLNYAWTLGEGAALPSVSDPFNVYTKLTDPMVDITETSIESYALYEGAALWELNSGGQSQLSDIEFQRRISLLWLQAPEYLQLESDWQQGLYCPPPVISVGDVERHLASRKTLGDYFTEAFSEGGGCDWAILGADPNANAHTKFSTWLAGWSSNESNHQAIHLMAAFLSSNGGFFYNRGWSPNYIQEVDGIRIAILAGGDVNIPLPDDHPNLSGYTALDILQDGAESWINLTSSDLQGLRGLLNHRRVYSGVRKNCRHDSRGWLACADDLLNESRDLVLKAAKILRANGAECVKKEKSSYLCSIEHDSSWTKFEPELPPNGGLIPVPQIVVTQGYTGEVFRVTATTDYADVDFNFAGLGDSFSATRLGEIVEFSGYGFSNGRINSGETTVVVVQLTNSALPVGTHEIEITADFFYHHTDLNTAVHVATIAVLSPGGLVKADTKPIASGHTGEVFRITATVAYADVDFEIVGPGNDFVIERAGTFSKISGSDGFSPGQRTYQGQPTVGIVRLANSDIQSGEYTLTVKAAFSYNVSAINSAAMILTVNVLGKRNGIVRKFDMGNRRAFESVEEFVGYRGEDLVAVSVSDLDYSFVNRRNDTIDDDGLIQLTNFPYRYNESTNILVKATSPNLVGMLTLNVKMQASCPGTAAAAGDTRTLLELVETDDYEAFCWRIANDNSPNDDGEYLSSIFPNENPSTRDAKYMWTALGVNRNSTNRIAVSGDGHYRIHLAARGGDAYLPVFKYLFVADQELRNSTTETKGRNVLMLASRWSGRQMLDFILPFSASWGIGINDGDHEGHTALHHSVYSEDTYHPEQLLAYGASINAKNNVNRTPLIEAAFLGESKMVKFLLEQNAVVLGNDDYGLGAIHYAIRRDDAEIACRLYIASNGVKDQSSGIEVTYPNAFYPADTTPSEAILSGAYPSMQGLFTNTFQFCADYRD